MMTSKRASQQKLRPKSAGKSRRGSAVSNGVETGLQSPILGKNFEIPELYSELQDIELDDTLPYVPIYCHFILPEIEPVVRPKTPPILTELRAELEEMQPTKSTKTKSEHQGSRNTHHNHRQSNKNH